MSHILDEGTLLALSLLGQTGGFRQFLIAATGLLGRVVDAVHMETDGLQHGGKTVLEPSDGIFALAVGNVYLDMAGGNSLGLGEQLIEGLDGLLHDFIAQDENDQHTDDE